MNKRPSPPITVWPLALVALAGLVAQYSSARAAFSLITVNGWHATGAALVIEGATVVEALVFIRSRNGYAALGLVVTMLASGVYNYTQASTAGADLGQWQLIAMSVGPLGALVSVGLALGDELRKHEGALVEWQTVQDEISQEAASALRRVTIQAERQADDQRRWERQLEQQRLQAELERENAAQAARIKEEGLARRRAEAAARRAEKKQAVSERPVSAHGDNGHSVTGQWTGRWADMASFVTDVADNPALVDGMSGAQFSQLTGKPKSTARRWLREARSNGNAS